MEELASPLLAHTACSLSWRCNYSRTSTIFVECLARFLTRTLGPFLSLGGNWSSHKSTIIHVDKCQPGYNGDLTHRGSMYASGQARPCLPPQACRHIRECSPFGQWGLPSRELDIDHRIRERVLHLYEDFEDIVFGRIFWDLNDTSDAVWCCRR